MEVQIHQIESNFKDIFLRMIKPFYLVIGNKDLEIAYNVLDKIKTEYKEVLDIIKDDYEVIFVFKPSTSIKRKKEILIDTIKQLEKAFERELGPIAKKMISFALKDLKNKYKILKKYLVS